MKLKTLILAAILPVFASAQTPNFSISGHIGSLNGPGKVYIDYNDGGPDHTDSATLVNGTFSFKGNILGMAVARLVLDHTGEGKQHSIFQGLDALYFYFGREDMVINSADSLLNARVTGSQVYSDGVAYNDAIGGTPMFINKTANEKWNSATTEQQQDPAFKASIDAWYHKTQTDRTKKARQFAIDNPHSFYAIVALTESAGAKINVADIEPIYNAIDEKWRSNYFGKSFAQRINAAKTILVGNEAPLFTLNDVNGKPVSLADLKGKIVLIDFWASWCEPCRAESPNIKTQYNLYKDKGFEVISVSIDKDKKSWLKAIADDGLNWIQVSDLLGYNSAVVKSYGIGGVPSFFLVGRDGKVIANTNLQGAGLNEKLAEIFKN